MKISSGDLMYPRPECFGPKRGLPRLIPYLVPSFWVVTGPQGFKRKTDDNPSDMI